MPSVSVRKRNGKRAHVSRAAQLEAKLEDLVTLLRHKAVPTDNAGSPGEMAGNASASTPALSTHSATSRSEASSPRSAAAAAAAAGPLLLPQQPDCAPGRARPAPVARGSLLGCVFEPSPPSMPSCIYQPSPLEAAEDLMTFRKYMLIFLPFVYLPTTMTSERLSEVHPFLWFCIMTITCKSPDRRLVMGDAVKKHLAQKMVIDHEKSLDLLLGLLVLMGW